MAGVRTFMGWLRLQDHRSDQTGWLAREAQNHDAGSLDGLVYSMLLASAPDAAWQILYRAMDEWRKDTFDSWQVPVWAQMPYQ